MYELMERIVHFWTLKLPIIENCNENPLILFKNWLAEYCFAFISSLDDAIICLRPLTRRRYLSHLFMPNLHDTIFLRSHFTTRKGYCECGSFQSCFFLVGFFLCPTEFLTIASEGLQKFYLYTWFPWPLSSERSLTCQISCDGTHTFTGILLFLSTRNTHTCCRALSKGAVTTCFNDF